MKTANVNCTYLKAMCSMNDKGNVSNHILKSNDPVLNDYKEYEISYFRNDAVVTIIFCVAYIVIFIVGAMGNSCVVAVIYRNPRMRNVTNFFIVNLALADGLVILFCLPGTLISNIITPWILGDFVCKVMSYFQGVSVSASIYTLVAISFDRFTAICFLKREISPEMCKATIIVIWIYSIVLSLPWALYFTTIPMFPNSSDEFLIGKDYMRCIDIWPNDSSRLIFFIVANLLLCYILPLAIITVCYLFIWIKVWTRRMPGESSAHLQNQCQQVAQRSRIKVVKMILAVVVFFALSWLPLYIVSAIELFTGSNELIPETLRPISQWLGLSNSSINPILYAYFNKKFREQFRFILTRKRSPRGIFHRGMSSQTSITRRRTKTCTYQMEEIVRDA